MMFDAMPADQRCCADDARPLADDSAMTGTTFREHPQLRPTTYLPGGSGATRHTGRTLCC